MVKFILKNVSLKEPITSESVLVKRKDNIKRTIIKGTFNNAKGNKKFSMLDVKTPIILSPNVMFVNGNNIDCEYDESCNRDCDYDRYPIEYHPIGIPIKYEHVKKGDLEFHVFHMKYYYCSTECCYSAILEEMKKIKEYRDYDPHIAKSILEKIFAMIYPGKKLKAAKDRMQLLKTGYGDMPISEFREPSLDLAVKNGNIKFVKCYIEYDLNKCIFT